MEQTLETLQPCYGWYSRCQNLAHGGLRGIGPSRGSLTLQILPTPSFNSGRSNCHQSDETPASHPRPRHMSNQYLDNEGEIQRMSWIPRKGDYETEPCKPVPRTLEMKSRTPKPPNQRCQVTNDPEVQRLVYEGEALIKEGKAGSLCEGIWVL